MGISKESYFAYLRKSSEDKERQALSIPAQKEKIRQQFPNLDITFLEEEKSAFVPYNRPIFTEALDNIQRGKHIGLIAWHPDRLSRNEIDASRITYMVRNAIIKDLKFCTYTFENTPEGIWMLQMALSQSQYESAKKGRDVKRGLEQRAKLGHYPAPAPLGYINEKYAERGSKRIFPDPKRFDLVRKMFDLMLTGSYTPPQILDIANETWGFRTPSGYKMSRSSIYLLFSRPFYYGRFEYPLNSGNWYKGAHKAMISAEEYHRIQELLGRTSSPKTTSRSLSFTYRGPLICGECGAMITAEHKIKRQKNGNVHRYIYYHCTKRKVRSCSQGSIEEKKLEAQITALLSDIELPPLLRDWATTYLSRQYENERSSHNALQDHNRHALEACERKLDRLITMRINGELTEQEFIIRKAELSREKEKHAALIESGAANQDEWFTRLKELFDFAETACKEFQNGDPKRRKQIFHALGSNLLLIDKKLRIDAPHWLLPMRAVAKEAWAVFKRFEPPENGTVKRRLMDEYAASHAMLRGLDDVRTCVQNCVKDNPANP